jgi:hypothetical protein
MLNISSTSSDMDMDYFEQLIKSKVASEGQDSYHELFAVR